MIARKKITLQQTSILEETMINLLLIQLTESDKRIIFVLLAVFILILVLIAYIGFLVTKIMKWQGKKINVHLTDVVMTGVITNEKDFKRYAKKKNWWLFYHQARLPALIVVLAIIFYVVISSILGFKNPFDTKTGFATLLFVWDFSTIITIPESGAGILVNWPALVNTPHIVKEAWVSYIFVPAVVGGGVWYLITVQAFIARFIQINRLGQKIYNEQIEHFIPNQPYGNPSPANNLPPDNSNNPEL